MVSDYLSFVRSAIENISSGFYDSFVEDNARAAGLSGARSVITRNPSEDAATGATASSGHGTIRPGNIRRTYSGGIRTVPAS